jgi:hypothetical protein
MYPEWDGARLGVLKVGALHQRIDIVTLMNKYAIRRILKL